MPSNKNLPLIIAHRGSSALAPENTLAAFRQAVKDKADGIEFDIRLAKDGVPVVIHDADLRRISGNRDLVSDLSSKELGRIDAGSWFNIAKPKRAKPDFFREKIPTLAKTLRFLKDFPGRIYIELKCEGLDAAPLVKAVCEIINASPLLPRIIVKSFAYGALPLVRICSPSAMTAALFAPKIMTYLRKKKHVITLAEAFGARHVSIHYSLATQKLMDEAAKRGMSVTIWTIEQPQWIKRAGEMGIEAIITNNPARLLAKRGATPDTSD